jgi:hypothetical protein
MPKTSAGLTLLSLSLWGLRTDAGQRSFTPARTTRLMLSLRLNPSNNPLNYLINRKIGRVEDMHAPSRVTTLPIVPTLPPHRIDLRAAYHILPPLRVNGMHTLPRRPGQHILCRSVRSTFSKAIQTDYVVAIKESEMNVANVRR